MIPYADLKDRQRAARHNWPETMGLRVHRAISWVGRAEAVGDTDPDTRFILLWVALNAAYAEESETPEATRIQLRGYFDKVVALDEAHRIYGAVWKKFPGPIKGLLENRFVYDPFWRCQNGVPGNDDWPARFAEDAARIRKAVQNRDTARLLALLFDRLYVLRNQLIHGGTTWNSRVNRAQVRDGAAILAFLVPVFIDLMMSSPQTDWGRPHYPVLSD